MLSIFVWLSLGRGGAVVRSNWIHPVDNRSSERAPDALVYRSPLGGCLGVMPPHRLTYATPRYAGCKRVRTYLVRCVCEAQVRLVGPLESAMIRRRSRAPPVRVTGSPGTSS